MEEGGKTGQGRGLGAGLQVSRPAPWLDHWVWAVLATVFTVVADVVAHPPFEAPEAAYVLFVPLILWLFRGRSFRAALWVGLAAGWAGWLAKIAWLRHSPEQAGMQGAFVLGWFCAIGLSGILALFTLAWVLVLRWTMARTADLAAAWRLLAMVFVASAWVLFEWVRSWIFTGFPWLPLAASQWQRPLILQFVSVTGAWGLSFLLVYFNLAIAFYIRSLLRVRAGPWWRRFSPELYSALALLFAAVFFGVGHLSRPARPDSPIRVAFIQPYISIAQKWDWYAAQAVLDDLEDITVLASYLKPDLILWPEAPTPWPIKGSPMMRDWVEGLSSRLQTPILAGNIAVEGQPGEPESRWFNAVFRIEPDSGAAIDDFYAKRHLVPFGEYVPLGRWLPFLEKLVPHGGNFYTGDSPALQPIAFGDRSFRFGPLICYEDLFPSLVRDTVRAGADFLFVATNNAWFGEEGAPFQHAAHSVLRAVESRRPVLRCGNGGWSGWIDENGQIRHLVLDSEGSIYARKADVVEVSRNRVWKGHSSIYTRYGDWFVWLSAAFTASIFILLRSRDPRPHARNL